MNKKSLLVILDGWGFGTEPTADAIQQAETPFFDNLIAHYPHDTLTTFGEKVGLPEGQMGNSEVGHLNIGGGRIVYQELARINKAIRDNSLAKEKALINALSYAKKEKKAVHILGLLSDGGVHSHIRHIEALAHIFDDAGIDNIYIHAFTDGRDTDPESGAGFVEALLQSIKHTRVSLATIIGRYFAMDRDQRWERIKKAYDLMVKGKGTKTSDPVEAMRHAYANETTDEFIEPILCNANGLIKANDVVVFANFRTDRPRQIVKALCQQDFVDYDMKALPLYMVTMTNYDEKFTNIHPVYIKDMLKDTLGEVLAKHNKTQLRIAETEKYPHVTFFFSGGKETAFPGEDRILVPSPKVATYDLKPAMSAVELTDKLIDFINQHLPDFICLNYANADMVGHTGVFKAAMTACETVDKCLSRLIPLALKHDYEIIIIADHGNSDFMINPDGSPNTAHTTNPVPVIYVSNDQSKSVLLRSGILADVAPTILSLMGIPQPVTMTGQSLLKSDK